MTALRSLTGSLILLAATSASALEKTAVPLSDRSPSDWSAGFTCTMSFYNTCTGWLWTWSGWAATETIGMTLTDGCYSGPWQPETLIATRLYAWSGAPSGYGFTGTVRLHRRDANDCAGVVIAQQPLLPADGPNDVYWGVPDDVNGMVVTYEHADALNPDPIVWPTDHPAAGPTGPTACGTCYPTTRATHAYNYGLAASPLCPGEPVNDGVCNAEWLFWAAQFRWAGDYVEASSWAKVKELYR